jgi:hypothetical protein
MINLIGISGRMNSGKDTVAGMIQDITGSYDVKRFAGKLKIIASILTGIPVEKFEQQDFKKQSLPAEWSGYKYTANPSGSAVLPKYSGDVNTVPMTVRELLQKLGTDAIRDHLHENAWVNALFADFFEGEQWIAPDTRFPNELSAIKQRGGIVIRVDRMDCPESGHASETALDNFQFDYVIKNYWGMEQLRENVLHMLAHFKIVNEHRLNCGGVL